MSDNYLSNVILYVFHIFLLCFCIVLMYLQLLSQCMLYSRVIWVVGINRLLCSLYSLNYMYIIYFVGYFVCADHTNIQQIPGNIVQIRIIYSNIALLYYIEIVFLSAYLFLAVYVVLITTCEYFVYCLIVLNCILLLCYIDIQLILLFAYYMCIIYVVLYCETIQTIFV